MKISIKEKAFLFACLCKRSVTSVYCICRWVVSRQKHSALTISDENNNLEQRALRSSGTQKNIGNINRLPALPYNPHHSISSLTYSLYTLGRRRAKNYLLVIFIFCRKTLKADLLLLQQLAMLQSVNLATFFLVTLELHVCFPQCL